MNTLLEVLDFLVLVLLVVQVVRWVQTGLADAPGGIILTICVALAVAFLATVSFTVYVGLLESSSVAMRIFYLAVVVAMGLMAAMSRTSKAAA